MRREPSLAEKLVYARLTYSPREKEDEKICKKVVALGLIERLDQTKLAHELGIRRECACGALKSLKKRGLIEYTGGQGAKGCIKFLWHPWIDETCALNAQVERGQACAENAQLLCEKRTAPERKTHSTYAENAQVSLASESIEKLRLEKGRENLLLLGIRD
jgi:hypothetical protein